jgi:hypothetical protein
MAGLSFLVPRSRRLTSFPLCLVTYLWYAICVIEVLKRCWQVFFPLSIACLGLIIQVSAYLKEWDYRTPMIVVLLVLAPLFFMIAAFALTMDIRDSRKKERESKTKDGWPRLY